MPSLSYSEQNRTNDFRNVLQCEAREPVWTGSKSGPGRLQLSGFFQEDFDIFGFRISMAWRGGVAAPDAEVLDSGWNFSRSWGSASDTRYAKVCQVCQVTRGRK